MREWRRRNYKKALEQARRSRLKFRARAREARRQKRASLKEGNETRCLCGCGLQTEIALSTRNGIERGEPYRFIHGHNARLQAPWKHLRRQGPRGWYRPESRNPNTGHERARKVKPARTCELLDIGGCLGRLNTFHLDRQAWNNADENLMNLCTSHQALVVNGRIDIRTPMMPAFYIGQGGKRRYPKPRHKARTQPLAAAKTIRPTKEEQWLKIAQRRLHEVRAYLKASAHGPSTSHGRGSGVATSLPRP